MLLPDEGVFLVDRTGYLCSRDRCNFMKSFLGAGRWMSIRECLTFQKRTCVDAF